MTEFKISRGAGLCLLLLAGAPLIAAEATNDGSKPEEPVSLEEYVEVRVPYGPTSNTIATKLPVSLQLTPANVGAISAPLLREQNALVLGDALRNVSGLNVQSGSGVHDYFLIRGFTSLDGGLVLTDGASEPEVSFYSMYNVEGVEVLKGPGGFLYGANPLAGTVNLVRKQPLPVDFTSFGASVGSYDTFEGNIDCNVASGDGQRALRLNALWREAENYRDDKESNHFAVNPSFVWNFGDDSRLSFNLEFVDAEYEPDSGIPLIDGRIPDVSRRTSYQSPVDFSDQQIYRFQVDFETGVSDSLTLRNKLYHRDLDWETAGTLLVGLNPFVPTEALRALTVLDDRQQFSGNQFELIYTRDSGRLKHSLLSGIEVARYTDEFDLDFLPPPSGFPVPSMPGIDVFNPVETYTEIGPLFPRDAGDARSVIVAPYMVDQIEFSDRFQVMLGLRYDDIDFEDDLDPGSNREDGELSPMVGVVFAPDPSLSIYANAGESFAPASPRVEGPNAPEESTQLELGVKKQFRGGKIRTTFAVYEIERDNIAIPVDDFTLQTGDQRSRGFEFELAAQLMPGLRGFLAYTYTDAELTSFAEKIVFGLGPLDFFIVEHSGNDPAFVPEHMINLWVSKSFNSGFGVAGGSRFVDEQFIAENNAFAIDSSVVFDAAVFYDMDAWRFKLNFKNLTDEEYETRGFLSNSVITATPFTVFAGVEFRR